MSLWRRMVFEAHRRSLWQVLSIYLIGSWIGFQVVLALVQGVGLPEWLPGAAAALFVIGLPIVLATAFIQEGGPAGQSQSATLDPTLFPDAERAAPAERRSLRSLLTWRRAFSAGVAAFAVLALSVGGLLGMRSIGRGPMASLLAAQQISENDRILIADFDARNADSTLAAVVSDAFRIDFARSTLVRAVTPTEIQDVLRRMGRTDTPRLDAQLVQQIAIRDGISAYVVGEVSTAGSTYLLSARLISTSSGEILVALRERARGEEGLIDAVDRLSRDLRRRTGESLRTVQRAEPLARVTTSSLEALRYYTQAHRAASWEGDPERARELHERALELDTAFAAAHRALAVWHNNAGDRDRAIEYAERALAHGDRMSETEHATALATRHLARGEFADAARALERVVSLDPRNFAALNNLGLTYAAMNDLERGEEYYRRSVAVDTSRFFAFTNLGEHLVLRGRFEEAEQVLRDAVRRAPQSSWPVVALAQLPYAAGDAGESERRLRALLEDTSNGRAIQGRAGERLYFLLRILGRYEEAAALFQAQIDAGGIGSEEALFLEIDRALAEIFVHEEPAEVRRYIASLRAALATSGGREVREEAALVCAWGGDPQCATALLDASGRGSELKPWSPMAVHFAHAGIAHAQGDHHRALRILRDARSTNCHGCTLPLVGIIFERMNQPDSAAAAFEKYIATPGLDRIYGDFVLAVLHERLAQHYETRGAVSAALQHYARVADIWKDADERLRPRVAAARRSMARLQPDG